MPELAALADRLDRADLLEVLRESIDAIEGRPVPFGPQPELPANHRSALLQRFAKVETLAKASGLFCDFEIEDALWGPAEPTEDEIEEEVAYILADVERYGAEGPGYWAYALAAERLKERRDEDANETLDRIGEVVAKARGRAIGLIASQFRDWQAGLFILATAPPDTTAPILSTEEIAYGVTHREDFILAAGEEVTWHRFRRWAYGRYSMPAPERTRCRPAGARRRSRSRRSRPARSGAPPGDPDPSPAPGDPATSALPSLEAFASLSLAWSSPRTASYPRRNTTRKQGTSRVGARTRPGPCSCPPHPVRMGGASVAGRSHTNAPIG